MSSGPIRDIEFIRSTSGGKIRRIWGVQLRAAEDLVRPCAPAQTQWNERIRGSISAAAGKLQTVAAKQLLRQLNSGGAACAGQFAYGFPIAGKMSRVFIPARGGFDSLLPVSGISDSPAARFRGGSRQIWPEECRPAAGRCHGTSEGRMAS